MSNFDYESEVIAAAAALPDDISLDTMSLDDAVTTLVRQRDWAIKEADKWKAEFHSRIDNVRDTDALREDSARDYGARRALLELENYMETYEAKYISDLTVDRIGGWIHRALEDSA